MANYDTKYSPVLCKVVKELANQGMTNVELCQFIGINTTTLLDWRRRYPEFDAAMKVGKEGPDERVKAAIFQRAVGYTATIKKGAIDKKTGEVREWTEEVHYPPDAVSCIFWLKNRQPRDWNDRQGAIETGFGDMSDAQLAALVREKAAKLVVNKAVDGILEGVEVVERQVKDVTPKAIEKSN